MISASIFFNTGSSVRGFDVEELESRLLLSKLLTLEFDGTVGHEERGDFA
jgi:hypothetical protein